MSSPAQDPAPPGAEEKKQEQPPPPGAIQRLVPRGSKQPTPGGTLTFVGLRALDPLLQYKLLVPGGWGAALLSRLGLAVLPDLPPVHTGIAAVDALGLPAPQLLLLSMAVGSAAKQIFWKLYLSPDDAFPAPAALLVCAYNTVVNSANSLLLTCAATSAALSAFPPFRTTLAVPVPFTGGLTLSLPVAAGALLYAAGITLETAAELQRKRFKDDPANKGRVCRTGLWAVARHANYAAYTLWRAGYSLAAGGWPAGLLMGWSNFSNFRGRAIVSLDAYMAGKYGEQWADYKRDVRWALFPGVY